MIGPFLIKLVEHPDTFARYQRDPVGAMEDEGLSDHEIVIVLSGDLKRLTDALQQEYPGKDIFLGQAPHIWPTGHAPLGQAPHVVPPEDGA